jgi:hypothetical protein
LTTSLPSPTHLHEYEKTNWHGHFHNLAKLNLVWMNSPICIQFDSIQPNSIYSLQFNSNLIELHSPQLALCIFIQYNFHSNET